MKKTLFLLLLLVLLCVIVLTFPVSAVPTSGNCGDSLTWSFDSASGTLTVTGTGSMKNNDSLPFWFDLRNDITRVVIDEGCTSISGSAFANCKYLTSVSLPKSVTTIDRYAFSACWALTDISLTNVTSIGENAFSQCYALTELTIPAGMTQIGYSAFSDCNKLRAVTFHKSVTEISSYAFKGCTALTSVTIPDSVKTIGGNAFYGCENLTQVHLGSGLTELGGNAFQNCTKLKSIRIPDKVTEIKTNTFNGCTALEELIIGAGVSKFDTTAIGDCPNLKAFTLNSNNTHFLTDKGVLYTKDTAELVCMPQGFTGNYTVLSGTKKIGHSACREAALESVTIPGSVTLIDSYAFTACQNLKTANLSYGLQQLKEYAFSRTAIEQLVIPESVTKIGVLAFSGCTSLKEMVFLGYPPTFGGSVFSSVEATIYYPVGIPEWEDLPYMGKLTWEAFTCDTHTVINIQAKAPTCTEDGCTEGSICGICKQVFTAWQVLPKTGHKYGPWVKNNAANPTDWTQKRICSACGDEDIIKSNYPDTNNSGNSSDQGSTKPVTPEDTNQTQPDPTIPGPTAPQSPTESLPDQDAAENIIPATDASTTATDPVSTDPADTPKDTGGTKNALLFVGIGIVLLGLATSGIFFLKPRLTGKKKE